MPQPELEDALHFFDDMIADRAQEEGISEEEVIAKLEPVQQIAAALREGRGAQDEAPEPAPQQDDGFEGRKTIRLNGDGVRLLELITSNVAVEVRPAAGSELSISYTQDRTDVYDYSFENGELRLIRRPLELMQILRLGFLPRLVDPVRVELPREFAGNCAITTRNARISAEGIRFWGWLKLRSSNAKMQLSGLTCHNELEAQTSNSSLTAEELEGKAIRLSTSNARLEATRLSSQGRLQLSTSNGKLLGKQLKAGGDMSLTTSNGGMQVEGLEADNIRLETSNANITGSIPGNEADYSVESRTSNGKNSLKHHRHQGPKQLSARTSNGNIRVEFQP